jgi:hypothetical protein
MTIVEYLHALMQRPALPTVCFPTLLACPQLAVRVESCGIPLPVLRDLGPTSLSWAAVQAKLGIGHHDEEDQKLQCVLRSIQVAFGLLQSLAAPHDSLAPEVVAKIVASFANACVASVRRTPAADGATADASVPSLATLCTATLVRCAPSLRELLLSMCYQPPRRPARIAPGSAVVPTPPTPAQPSAPTPVRVTRSQSLGGARVNYSDANGGGGGGYDGSSDGSDGDVEDEGEGRAARSTAAPSAAAPNRAVPALQIAELHPARSDTPLRR